STGRSKPRERARPGRRAPVSWRGLPSTCYGLKRAWVVAEGSPFETGGIFENYPARGGQSGNPGRHDHAELSAADVPAGDQAEVDAGAGPGGAARGGAAARPPRGGTTMPS